LLPNHRNPVPAAGQACRLSSKAAAVVRTESVLAGLAAAAAFDPASELEANTSGMSAAASACVAGEVAQATRSARSPVGPVAPGDWIAVRDGTVIAVDPKPVVVAVRLSQDLREAGTDREVVTVVLGA